MTKARDIASASPAPSTVSATEIGYLDGVSSAIQTQLDTKTAKSTLTTKGDIYAASAASTPTRLAVGADLSILVADSSEATGLKWQAPAGGGGMTLISTTTLTGASVSLTSIPQTYIHLQLIIEKYLPSVDGQSMFMRFNANSSANQYLSNLGFTGDVDNSVCDSTEMRVTGSQANSAGLGQITINIPNYTNANTRKFMWATSLFNSNTEASARIDYWQRNGYYLPVEAITGISLRPFNPNFSGGTAYLYGVK